MLKPQAGKLQKDKRLALVGHANFPRHHQAIHDLMEQLKVPHEHRDERKPRHTWDAGWMEEAVGFLTGAAAKKPATKLWEWERGIAVESRARKGMAVFLGFYEWNKFDLHARRPRAWRSAL